MLVETQAIVLHARKFGDSSKIVTVFTHEFGKLNLLAKGCRSPKSKIASALETFNLIRLDFYKKNTTDLHLLSKAEIITPFCKISESYEHLAAAMLFIESIIFSQHDSEKNEELFDIIVNMLTLLKDKHPRPMNVYLLSQSLLCSNLGFELTFGAVPGNEEHSGDFFYSFENGTVYANQNQIGRNVFRLTGNQLGILQNVSSGDVDYIGELMTEIKDIRAFINFFAGYFSYHFDKKIVFKSANLLA